MKIYKLLFSKLLEFTLLYYSCFVLFLVSIIFLFQKYHTVEYFIANIPAFTVSVE